jgi:patatin-like phospholipase/acyl hydrolase
MQYYQAFSHITPTPAITYPMTYKTEVFQGTSETHNLADGYIYFKNPKIYILQTIETPYIWGDPLAYSCVGYTQTNNNWLEVPCPSFRLKWDLNATNELGIGGTFIGEIITPLRGINAYNTHL